MSQYERIEEMLYSYKPTVVKIAMLELEIEQIKNNYKGTSAISMSEKIAPTNKIASMVENEVIERERQIEALQKKKRNMEIEVAKVDNMLTLLNETEYELVQRIYFENMSFKEIACRMGGDDKSWIKKRKKIIERKLVPLMTLK